MTADESHDFGNDMNQILFINLITMLGSSAMQQMGKLVNPITKKTEINLESAQITIDMIAMLKDKTKGNLSDEENAVVADILSSLQMNYVETTKEETAKKTNDKTESKEDTKNTDDPDPDPTNTSEEQAEQKQPGLHNSYEQGPEE